MQQGPWFINEFFLTVKGWHPTFVASEAKETNTAIWLYLPKLPTEFCDHQILAKVGKRLGKLVKMDICISATLRGRYTRICTEIPLGILVKKYVTIGMHKQNIVYEGENILCSLCGVLGHMVQ